MTPTLIINSTLTEIYSNPTNDSASVNSLSSQSLKNLQDLEQELADITADKTFTKDYFVQVSPKKAKKCACKNGSEDGKIENSNEDEKDGRDKDKAISDAIRRPVQDNDAERLLAEYKRRVENVFKEFGIEM